MLTLVAILSLWTVAVMADGSVVTLTKANFDAETKGKTAFVKFFAPWCGHCKALAPTWKEAAAKLNSDSVLIGDVDCTQEDELCAQFNVNGYPTLILRTPSDEYREFVGSRALAGIEAFVQDPSVGDLVTRSNADAGADEAGESNVIAIEGYEQFDKLVTSQAALLEFYAPWCGFCKKLAPVWDVLSVTMEQTNSGVAVAKIDCTSEANSKLCNDFQVRGFPTIYAVTADGEYRKYTGKREPSDFLAFSRDMSTDSTPFSRPFVLNTGVPFIDENWPMMRDDLIVLYNFKKAALAVVFALGVLTGLVLSRLCCGGKCAAPAAGKKKKE